MKSYTTRDQAQSTVPAEHLPKSSDAKDPEGRSTEMEELVGNAAVAAELEAQEISVAVYAVIGEDYKFLTDGMDEIKGAARDFAEDHQSWGVKGGATFQGRDAAFGAASPSEATGYVGSVTSTLEAETGHPAKVETLAIFAHGEPDGIGLGAGVFSETRSKTSAEEFADALDGSLSGDAKVILYACKAGSTEDEARVPEDDEKKGEQEATQGDEEKKKKKKKPAYGSDPHGGEGSFGDVLRDELTEGEGNEGRSVYARQIPGHTAGNPTWRHYEGRQEGDQASEPLFDERSDAFIAQKTRDKIRDLLLAGPGADRDPSWLFTWVGRELPFAPESCRPFADRVDEAPFDVEDEYTFWNGKFALHPDLVTWFMERLPEHTSSESED